MSKSRGTTWIQVSPGFSFRAFPDASFELISLGETGGCIVVATAAAAERVYAVADQRGAGI